MNAPELARARPPLWSRASAKLKRWSSIVTRRLLLPFASEPTPDRWIFVLGCYNSGTSLLSRILASHPQVSGMPDEGIYFTDALPFPEQFGWPRMWVRCFDDVHLDPSSTPPETVSRIKKQWSLAYPRGATNLVEKSVSNVPRIAFLEAHFQPAFFVAIIRNGYAVSEGIRRRAQPGRFGNPLYGDSYPLELCAEQWRATDEVITRERHGLARFLQIRYEELTERPGSVLSRVTDFLELPPLPESVLDRTWSIKDRMEPIRNMNRRSLERMSRRDFEIVEDVAGDALGRYGYLR